MLTDRDIRDIQKYVSSHSDLGIQILAEKIAGEYNMSYEDAKAVLVTFCFVNAIKGKEKKPC